MNTNIEWFRFGYDFTIMSDLQVEEDTTKECQCRFEDIRCPRHGNEVPIYCLGDRGDTSVGINPFFATKWFKSVEELEAWCNRNRAELERLLESLFADRPEFQWEDYSKAMETLQ